MSRQKFNTKDDICCNGKINVKKIKKYERMVHQNEVPCSCTKFKNFFKKIFGYMNFIN